MKMPNNICSKCDKIDYDTNYFEKCEEKKIMNEQNVCFNCAFWIIRSRRQDDLRSVITEGGAYWLSDETKSPDSWRGFSGRKFVIKFTDGRQITSTNLWYNGNIPKHFKDDFLVNAEFLE